MEWHLIETCDYTGATTIICGADSTRSVHTTAVIPEGDKPCRECVKKCIDNPGFYDSWGFYSMR